MGYINLFLCGDVMLGRGIDQVLPYPGDDILYEPGVKSAKRYVKLAESTNGPIPQPVSFEYVWGDALHELDRRGPDARIINLETSITHSPNYWKAKEVHYKMNPANVPCITAAGIDCCALANNHVMDWGYEGIAETLETLKKANVKSAGAGKNSEEAQKPAVLEAGKGRIIVFSLGITTSGIPASWTALDNRPGVNLLSDLSDGNVERIRERVRMVEREGDVTVASVHWGANWGFGISPEQIQFAHGLIDRAGVDIIHGHSSHHVKGIEVYRDKPILYGCGDLLNDYEGISGQEHFRSDLGLMYFLTVDASLGTLVNLLMTPTQIKHFRVNRASPEDMTWLKNTLNWNGTRFGTTVENTGDALTLRWRSHSNIS